LEYDETPPVAEVEEQQEEQQEEKKEEKEEVVAESQEEVTTSESSLNSEETSSTEESKPVVEETTFDFDAEVAKRTEGKFESFESMVESANAPKEETKEFEYGNELIAKLDDLAKQGVSIDLDFITAQMKDYSKFDLENVDQAKSLVEMERRLNEPDITQREIDFELSEKYKLDADEYDEVDIERSQLRLMRDAKKARKSLEENQKNMAVPKGGIDPEKQRVAQEQAVQAKEKLNKALKDGLSKYEKESLQIGDETFDYTLTPETKKSLEKVITNTDKFFHQYISKDGSIDTKKLNSDMLWLTDRENMLKSYVQQATAKGSKDVVQGIKNTSFEGKAGKSQQTDYTIGGAIANHFKNKK